MHRRALLTGAAAVAALGLSSCSRVRAQNPGDALPPLKSIAPYPLGVAARASQLDDPAWAALAARHFSRLTAEWEMKMEYILQPDGSLRFDRADAMAAFARAHGMTVHGHTLIWYAEDGQWFQAKVSDHDAFLNAYAGYIGKVVGRYRGVIPSWDVVNEPVRNDGSGLRSCLWQQVLGDDYIGLALTAAHDADPQALLFINDYNLESTPAKRRRLLNLCEDLLKDGAPLHGIGTQTHIDAALAPGLLTAAIRDIASLGLKVHISEVDISLHEDHPASMAEPRIAQVRLLEELVRAYGDVPAAQRHGLTFWGLRDSDSWINKDKNAPKWPADEPLLFDSHGQAKPLVLALARALK